MTGSQPLTNCRCLAFVDFSATRKTTKLAGTKDMATIMKMAMTTSVPWSLQAQRGERRGAGSASLAASSTSYQQSFQIIFYSWAFSFIDIAPIHNDCSPKVLCIVRQKHHNTPTVRNPLIATPLLTGRDLWQSKAQGRESHWPQLLGGVTRREKHRETTNRRTVAERRHEKQLEHEKCKSQHRTTRLCYVNKRDVRWSQRWSMMCLCWETYK